MLTWKDNKSETLSQAIQNLQHVSYLLEQSLRFLSRIFCILILLFNRERAQPFLAPLFTIKNSPKFMPL